MHGRVTVYRESSPARWMRCRLASTRERGARPGWPSSLLEDVLELCLDREVLNGRADAGLVAWSYPGSHHGSRLVLASPWLPPDDPPGPLREVPDGAGTREGIPLRARGSPGFDRLRSAFPGAGHVMTQPLLDGVNLLGELSLAWFTEPADPRAVAGFLEAAASGLVTVGCRVESLRDRSLDRLTGTYRARCLMELLGSPALATARAATPVSIVHIDIDHLITINDTRGHATGDRVISEVGHRLSARLGEEDLMARVEGNVFVVLFQDRSLRDAVGIAEELRNAVAAVPIEEIAVTVTIGVSCAEWFQGESLHAPAIHARYLCWSAKQRAGGNQVWAQVWGGQRLPDPGAPGAIHVSDEVLLLLRSSPGYFGSWIG